MTTPQRDALPVPVLGAAIEEHYCMARQRLT